MLTLQTKPDYLTDEKSFEKRQGGLPNKNTAENINFLLLIIMSSPHFSVRYFLCL